MNNSDFLKILQDNPDFKRIIDLVKDEKEKAAIKAITERFFLSFQDSISQTQDELQKDPEGFKKRLFEEAGTIVSTSGSTGQ